jgi:hypothetical protein
MLRPLGTLVKVTAMRVPKLGLSGAPVGEVSSAFVLKEFWKPSTTLTKKLGDAVPLALMGLQMPKDVNEVPATITLPAFAPPLSEYSLLGESPFRA